MHKASVGSQVSLSKLWRKNMKEGRMKQQGEQSRNARRSFFSNKLHAEEKGGQPG